ncbi:MAG: Ser-Thr-rich GPI-anchored membrane family protein [Promethearchaeota archaeon]
MQSKIDRKRIIISTLVILFLIASPILVFILNINARGDITHKALPILSVNEINIVTPENTTYSASMSGFYPSTYGFDNDIVGGYPDGWTSIENGGTIRVFSNFDGHNKLINLNDTSGGGGNDLRINFNDLIIGTIEFWMGTDNVTELSEVDIWDVNDTNWGIQIGILSSKFQYKQGDNNWYDIPNVFSPISNKLHHWSVRFNCTAHTFHIIIDGVDSGELSFKNPHNSFDRLQFHTSTSGMGFNMYVDAVGFSWTPGYSIGDNLNEGLLLSFENSILLDWIGYSLDGQANITIIGNHTISMPLEGVHSIQIYGNDSIGTVYPSSLRYFTVKYPNLKVSLEVPDSCELNNTYTINATVSNIGGREETNVNFYLFLDNIIINSTIIPTLATEENKTIKYLWTPTEYDIYNFTVYTVSVPGEIDTGNNYKTELIRVSNSVLFNGIYIDFNLNFWDSDEPYDTYLDYSYLSGNTFRAHWLWPSFLISFNFRWSVDTTTRLMSNRVGDPIFGDIFIDDYHDFAWIPTDTKLNDTISIAAIWDLEHTFNVTDEIIYDLPNYGPVEVWILQDLNFTNYFAWYEKSTGILINGSFYNQMVLDAYYLEFQATNAQFEYAAPPGPFTLSSNAGAPDKDGNFDLSWTTSFKADEYSIYNYTSYITKINGSVTLLADEITNFNFGVSGLLDGTYYYITVAHNQYGDTLSNCIKVDVALPPTLHIILPDISSSWDVDTSQIIQWSSTGTILDIKIELYVNGIFTMEIVSETSNDGEYSWRIPTMLEYSNQYQIKITDALNSSIYDFSDYFEIFKSSITIDFPDSSCSWEIGRSYYINWSDTGDILDVTLELYNDGVFVMEIVASTTNLGEYYWTIPSGLEGSFLYQIKIMDASDPAVYHFSSYFEIKKVIITPQELPLPLIIGLSTGGAVAGIVIVLIVRRYRSRTKGNR